MSLRFALLPLLVGCLAHADTPVADTLQYECTSFPVRSTTAVAPFQAPADVSNARVNPTLLPAGWQPIGGTTGEGGAHVIACRAVGAKAP